MLKKTRSVAALLSLAVVLGLAPATASTANEGTAPRAESVAGAANADALSEWSGTVLGGTELDLPNRSRSISFASIHPGANFTLGIDTQGRSWSWGINGFGQLGNDKYIGQFIFAPYPVPMIGIDGEQLQATAMAAGENFSLVLDRAGKAWTYGRNSFGQLGNPGTALGGSFPGTVTPVPVEDATGTQMTFEQVEAGVGFAFGIQNDGTAWAWGRNLYGQLGADSNASVFITPVSNVATPVLDVNDNRMCFSKISAGEDFTIGIDCDGKAWGWGSNSGGMLGSPGSDTNRPRPILTPDGKHHQFAQVASGYDTAYGIDKDGHVWAWGSNSLDQLGNPDIIGSTDTPVKVLNNTGDQLTLRSISTRGATAVGVDDAGRVWAWGHNPDGQLGQAPEALGTSSAVPVQVFREPGIPLIADNAYAGDSHVTAIGAFDDSTHSNAWAWGASWYGQLGNPDVDTSATGSSPQPVPIALPQPSSDTVVFFGDDDMVGVTGTVRDGTLVVAAPPHLAGRVPVYVAWFGDEPTRELVGYFTFLLDPTLQITPTTLDIEGTANAVVTVPDAEIPYIGEAKIQFTIPDDHLEPKDTTIDAPRAFDTNGTATLPVTSRTAGTYTLQAQAWVASTPASDPPVAVSGLLEALVTFEADEVVTPPVSSKYGQVTLNKLDQDGRPLTSAQFNLLVSHNPNPDFTITDDTDKGVRDLGTVCDMTVAGKTSCTIKTRYSDWSQSTQLLPGDDRWNYYWIVETRAPEGYELLAERIPFEITRDLVDDNDAIPDINVTNIPRGAGLILPFTGGTGYALFAALGAGLLLAGYLVGLARSYRARRLSERMP